MFELAGNIPSGATIKVIGVGGGGGNAVQHMVETQVVGVDFICANTDSQALENMEAQTLIQIGSEITQGLGAGANPDVGRQSALEDRERVTQILEGANMVFIAAGMGGGTGTGAAPVVAQIARDLGILTVAVVTKPFKFEGSKRMRVASEGIDQLREHVDSLIIIPNEKLLPVLGKGVSLKAAFAAANDVLKGAVQGISDLIKRPGDINVDFADVKTVMSEMGMAMMGTGEASGDNRVVQATEAAINSPLLEGIDLRGAKGVLVNITANEDISLHEYSEVNEMIQAYASEEATIVTGVALDSEVGDTIKVTVVATGLSGEIEKKPQVAAAEPRSNFANTKVDLELPAKWRRSGDRSHNTNTPEQEEVEKPEVSSEVDETDDIDLLDIPAFLRK